MAIEETRSTTDRTLLAAQHIDRMAPVPYALGVFRRVVPTGEIGAYGLPLYRKHPEPWSYSIRIDDPALIIDRQAHALWIIVYEAFVEAGTPKTPAEVNALVVSLMQRGISFDHAQVQAWENLETRRRAGEVFPITVDVTEGKKHMEAFILPTR